MYGNEPLLFCLFQNSVAYIQDELQFVHITVTVHDNNKTSDVEFLGECQRFEMLKIIKHTKLND